MGRKVIDLARSQFGFWTVLELAGSKDGNAVWLCRCTCGVEKIVRADKLRGGYSTSCGCRYGDNHGHALGGMSPTYNSWQHMKQRCMNANADNYRYYGGRGITVCERWERFSNFLADMGERPAGTSIDRINPDGNYEPGNCRWSTSSEQANNRRAVSA